MGIKISLIMPVYNAGSYLESAIESVRNQQLQDFELILVDDGSTDQSGEICDRFAQKDARIRVVHQQNAGICAARNVGLSEARGEYVGFMDNDDALSTAALQDNYSLLKKHDADWIKFGKQEILIRAGKVLNERATAFEEAIYEGREILDNLLKLRAQDAMTFVWDSFIKRQILVDSKLQFDPYFKSGNEDIDFCEQLAALCKKLVVNPNVYYTHYTRIGVSASSKYSANKVESYLYLLKKSNARYKEYGLENEQADEDYLYIVTKQIVVNACQKLNDAGKQLSGKEKIKVLSDFYHNRDFARYRHISPHGLLTKSKKLFLYCLLFQNRMWRVLLALDKVSRKVIYRIRAIGAK